jgi:hypothetical protein
MKNESKGLGDTIEKFTHFFGLDKLAERIAHLFGKKDCGCKRRRDKLNEIIPYKKNNKL